MAYISGSKHKATDAISRRPVGPLYPFCLFLPDDDANPTLKPVDALGRWKGVPPLVEATVSSNPTLKPVDALGKKKGVSPLVEAITVSDSATLNPVDGSSIVEGVSSINPPHCKVKC